MALSLSPALRQKFTDFWMCLSAANLCFMKRWYDLEHLEARSMDYFRTAPSTPLFLYATLICIAITSVVFWAVLRAVRATGNLRLLRIAQGIGLLTLIFPLETVRRYWNFEAGRIDWGSTIPMLLVDLMVACGAVAVLAGNTRVMRATQRAVRVLVFAPFVLLAEFAGFHWTAPEASAYQPKPALPWLPASERSGPGGRLIWIIFDEFDQRVAFDQRPSHLKMPEMDRLASESLVATHALQTAPSTLPALPSLISGRIFTSGEPRGVDNLFVTPEGGLQGGMWTAESTVFQRARSMGINSALAGWHHPYCRVLGDQLTDCFTTRAIHFPTLLRERTAAEDGLARTIQLFFKLQWVNLLDLFHAPEYSQAERLKDRAVQAEQQKQFLSIRERSLKAATDPRIGLLFLHIPAPHLFAIYDRSRGSFSLSDSTTYWDNLALVDRTVGELRRTLEQAKLWDTTSLLISADHGLRYQLWHERLNWSSDLDQLLAQGSSPTVPFILHVAGSDRATVYPHEFSTVVSGDLAISVLSGEVKSSEDAAAWLAHRTPRVISARQGALGSPR